jgi:hypothetical protein
MNVDALSGDHKARSSRWPGLRVSVYCSVARANGKIVSTEFALEYGEPFSHFGYLSRNIERMFRTGRPVYPVERTGITTGITSAMMESNAKGGARIETPYLRIPYRSYELAQRGIRTANSSTNAKRSPLIRPYGHTRPGKTGESYKPIGYFEGE